MKEDLEDEGFLEEDSNPQPSDPANDDIDPLDAFMNDLAEGEQAQPAGRATHKQKEKGECVYSENESSSPEEFSGDSASSMSPEERQ